MRKEKVSDKEIELWKRIETERTIFRYRMLASPAREIYELMSALVEEQRRYAETFRQQTEGE